MQLYQSPPSYSSYCPPSYSNYCPPSYSIYIPPSSLSYSPLSFSRYCPRSSPEASPRKVSHRHRRIVFRLRELILKCLLYFEKKRKEIFGQAANNSSDTSNYCSSYFSILQTGKASPRKVLRPCHSRRKVSRSCHSRKVLRLRRRRRRKCTTITSLNKDSNLSYSFKIRDQCMKLILYLENKIQSIFGHDANNSPCLSYSQDEDSESKSENESTTSMKSNISFSPLCDKTYNDLISELCPKISKLNQTCSSEVCELDNYVLNKLLKGFQNLVFIPHAFQLLHRIVKPPITVAVMGEINSGKSTLLRKLIGETIWIPSSETRCTSRITRLVFSEEPILRLIRVRKWNEELQCFVKIKEEVMKEVRNIDRSVLNEYLNLTSKERLNEELTTQIIEIGIPSEILKSGLNIIDLPGFDECQNLSKLQLQILKDLYPSIICYIYDFRRRFRVKDGEFLDHINSSLHFENRSYVQYILVANKFDNLNGNVFDEEFAEELSFDEQTESKSVHRNSCFRKSNQDFEFKDYFHNCEAENSHQLLQEKQRDSVMIEKDIWFKFDLDQLLPVQPLSAESINSGNEDGNTLFTNFLNRLLSAIANQPAIFLRQLADYLALEQIPVEEKMNAWFEMKSSFADPDLIGLIKNQRNKSSLLVQFSEEFKIYGLRYRRNDIQVTVVPNNKKQKERIFMERNETLLKKGSHPACQIYENKEQSLIYLIDKNAPHKRLIDHMDILNTTDRSQMIRDLLLQVIKEQHYLGETIPNFRPDNIYIRPDGSIFINRNVPNDPQIYFKLKDLTSVKPFHLHPDTKLRYPYSEDDFQNFSIIEFIYSFGWFTWMMIDGTGENYVDDNQHFPALHIDLLKSGKLLPVPEYLQEVLTLCFNLDSTTSAYSVWDGVVQMIRKPCSSVKELKQSIDSRKKHSLMCDPSKLNNSAKYTKKQLTFIKESGWGCLDDNNYWNFELANFEGDKWRDLQNHGPCSMWSREVMLPQELFGLTISIILKSVPEEDDINDEFKIQIQALDTMEFPVVITVFVEIEMEQENMFLCLKHKFKLQYRRVMAEPDNFQISLRHLKKDKLPRMFFRFLP